MNALNERTQTFDIFPDLPLEIRLKIWRHTPHLFPRIIEVRPYLSPTKAWDPLTTKHHVRATTPLILLQINREARRELLPFYTRLSSDVRLNLILDADSASVGLHEKPPWVNFAVDTLYFNTIWSTGEEVQYFSFVQRLFQDFHRDKQLVRRIAVGIFSELAKAFHDIVLRNIYNPDGTDAIYMFPKPTLLEFKDLEQLVLINESNHLRAERRLIALEDDESYDDRYTIVPELKKIEDERMLGWKVPKIRICSTVAAPVDNQEMESQSSYLRRVYGEDFVDRFMAPH
ncbi:94a0fa6d-f3a2-4f05-b335-dfe5e47266f9-CDS [Sclerotinia trifoliorum]|uniref:94a0fa6d-f3a2-4f05-b335-dfe5e47266f9-CDS n=1 Tax=Sclerotinia trifoliorum TaxID=28548 RepID=A0A8H2VUM5_9HELO|nr:94a0fa6d-f3a2-4f05-b335-dfe5e47266f9-CDS [Sclerotinia trifoliorum]